MIKITKSKINILFLLITLLLLIPNSINSIQKYEMSPVAPKTSGYWVMGPLYIKDTGGGDYTWSEAVAQTWCRGAGTVSNPYILENITIDAGWIESGILIEDSQNKTFEIKNCTVMRAGGLLDANAGIKIINSKNGTIENNKVLNNIKTGIFLQTNCEYITVKSNYIYNSSVSGIRVFQSTNNYIVDNIITEGDPSFSDGVYIDNDSEFNLIRNNTITGFVYGMEVQYNSNNNTISKNKINDITWQGIYLHNACSNNTVTMNSINGTWEGLLVAPFSNGSLIYGNSFTNNNFNGHDQGLYNRWDNGSFGNYWDDYPGDDLDDDGIGDDVYDVPGVSGSKDYYPLWDDGLEPIYIDGEATGIGAHNWTWAANQPWCTGSGTPSVPYIIEGISRDGRGDGFCVSIQNSDVFFEIRNSNFSNAGFTWPDTAILLNNVANATIIGNDLRDTNFVGIYMDNCDYNYIVGNNASFTDLGLIMTNSEFNYVIDNYVYDAIENAFNIDDSSHNNTISGNTAINNQLGISIFNGGHNNTVVGNTVINNAWAGIGLIGNADGNYVYNNEISDNNIGLSIPISDSQYNTIYNNTFTLNDLHAEDESLKNKWNLGTLGNYWDNYTGTDLNDDGIGDIPYNVSGAAGSKDYFPIWDDGDDTNPTISINSPSGGSLFGTDAPTYNLNIFDLNLNMSWYTLNSTATRYFFTPTNGVNVVAIDETAWDTFSSGSILMTFYVNDSGGNLASVSNLITKDAILPTITVNSPLGGTSFGLDAPVFNLTIFDLNLFEAEYLITPSLIGDSFSPVNGINIVPIDESSWDALAEGSYTFTFSVTDDAGNVRTIQVILNKDLPSGPSEPAIPFGDYYLVFLGIGIASILLLEYRKRKN